MPTTYPYLVLLAEDDADDQFFLETALREIDPLITLSIAEDGLKAFSFFQRTAERPFSLPRFIITDLNMPKMNGFEFIEMIKKSDELKHIPVFVLSTSEDEKNKTQAITSGANGYYVKPMNLTQLKPIIEEMMECVSRGINHAIPVYPLKNTRS